MPDTIILYNNGISAISPGKRWPKVFIYEQQLTGFGQKKHVLTKRFKGSTSMFNPGLESYLIKDQPFNKILFGLFIRKGFKTESSGSIDAF